MRVTFLIGLALLAFPVAGNAQGTPAPAPAPVTAPGAAPALPSGASAVVPLWTGGAPGFEQRKDIPEQAASYWVKSVNNPTITVFLPPKEKATGAAVILCPGGGFRELGFVPEGIAAARYFNSIGVAAFALKYRLPREEGSVYNMTHPRQDGLRAVRLVRSRAVEWGLDPKRIGMVGFSAGGEVVSMTAFGDTAGDTTAADPVDKLSARPDFIVEIYPGGAGIPQTLPPDAPPAFLLVANDDNHTDSVLRIFRLYREAKVPVEVHVFTKGAHAFNMGTRSKLTTIKNWPQRLADWMGDNNLLNPAVPERDTK
ncbi:MAG: alpha/beta hydrolase [Armatimonadota bacterium]